MRTLLLVAALTLVASFALAADVVGTYTGHGANPGGAGGYDCDVVVAKNGDVYSVQWYFGGNLGYDGVGIMKNGLFCVGFASPQGYGVVVYTANADGSLDGVWTMPGATDLGTETLKRK